MSKENSGLGPNHHPLLGSDLVKRGRCYDVDFTFKVCNVAEAYTDWHWLSYKRAHLNASLHNDSIEWIFIFESQLALIGLLLGSWVDISFSM